MYEELYTMFKNRTGYRLNIENPKTFNEKIQFRKIFDHNPLYPKLVDKYESKRIAKEIVPSIGLFETLWIGNEIDKVPFICPSVIKNTSGSGSSWKVLKPLSEEEKRDIRGKMRHSLSKTYGSNKYEWAYSQVPKRIIVERFHPNPFIDVKFWTFAGDTKAIAIMEYEKGKISGWTVFDEKFERLPVQSVPYVSKNIEFPVPIDKAEEGVDIARELSRYMDFIRIDLYYVPSEEKWYFSEFTLYPTSGMAKYDPVDFDVYLGSQWRKA